MKHLVILTVLLLAVAFAQSNDTCQLAKPTCGPNQRLVEADDCNCCPICAELVGVNEKCGYDVATRSLMICSGYPLKCYRGHCAGRYVLEDADCYDYSIYRNTVCKKY